MPWGTRPVSFSHIYKCFPMCDDYTVRWRWSSIQESTNLEATNSNFYSAAGNINNITNVNIAPPPSDHTSLQRFNDAPTDILATHFTGRRKELEFLHETFKEDTCAVPIRCVVYGMPGLGKTSLVLQYATVSFDQGGYSQVLWMSGTTVEKLNKGMTKILDLIEHPERNRMEQDSKLTASRRWLEGSHGDHTIRWLLVIDNVNRNSLGFLREQLPRRSAQGNILFTTRTADVADALVDVTAPFHRKLEIHVPDMVDATHLFFSNAGIDTNNTTSTQTNEAKNLIEAVGSLPLAIVHAAAYKKQTQTTLEDILQLYQGENKGEMLRWENDLTSYQMRSVTATFEALFAELDRDSSDVAGFLILLSFLDPERIQLRMLVDGAAMLSRPEELPTTRSPHPTPNVFTKIRNLRMFSRKHGKLPAPEVKSTATLSPDFRSLLTLILSSIRLTEAVQTLQRLSLVRRVSHDDQSALRIHDLVQYMVTERAKKVDTYRDFLRSTVSLVCRAFERVEDPSQPRWWPECEKFMPHLHSLNERWSDVHGVNLDLAEADLEIANYLSSRGRYGEAEVTCKRSIGRFEKECGTNHQRTLAAHVLAWVYYQQGRYGDAETTYERVIEDKKKTLGADHHDTLSAMSGLGIVYEAQGRTSEGEELLKRVLASHEKNVGLDHHDALRTMDNLARVYIDQGRYVDAEHLFKRALAGKEKSLGPDHTHTLITVHNLALAYASQERYAEAEELYVRALRIGEQEDGHDHPETLTTVFNLARVYLSQMRYGEAEEYFNRALSGRMQRLGVNHPCTSLVARNLAAFYRSQGRDGEADALLGSIQQE